MCASLSTSTRSFRSLHDVPGRVVKIGESNEVFQLVVVGKLCIAHHVGYVGIAQYVHFSI